jgi:hypothetical protein
MIDHDIFYKKYHAERDKSKALLMMKDYMLSLSSADLHSFIFDNLRAIRTYVETTKLTDKERLEIARGLDKAKNLILRRKKAA